MIKNIIYVTVLSSNQQYSKFSVWIIKKKPCPKPVTNDFGPKNFSSSCVKREQRVTFIFLPFRINQQHCGLLDSICWGYCQASPSCNSHGYCVNLISVLELMFNKYGGQKCINNSLKHCTLDRNSTTFDKREGNTHSTIENKNN